MRHKVCNAARDELLIKRRKGRVAAMMVLSIWNKHKGNLDEEFREGPVDLFKRSGAWVAMKLGRADKTATEDELKEAMEWAQASSDRVWENDEPWAYAASYAALAWYYAVLPDVDRAVQSALDSLFWDLDDRGVTGRAAEIEKRKMKDTIEARWKDRGLV